MLCPKCQAEQTGGNTYCTACGARLDGKPKRSTFLKFTFFLAGLAAVFYLLTHFIPSALIDTVKGQLGSLKNNELTKAYYAFTSKEFQEQIPLDKFKEFIKSYPILNHYDKVTYGDEVIDADGIGEVKAQLFSAAADPQAELTFILEKEDETWKITSLELFDPAAEEDPPSVITDSEMIKPIEDQLKNFQENNLVQAYETTSEQFQQAVPIDKFKEFIFANPILKDFETHEWVHQEKAQDKGDVQVVLSSGTNKLLLDYQMILQNGQWKVLLMHVAPADEHSESHSKEASEGSDVLSIVRHQLEALQKNEIKDSYPFMAQELQTESSYQNYVKLLGTYPFLTKYIEANIHEPSIESGIGKVLVEFHGDQGVATVEYTLGLENEVWKIWGIHVVKNPELTNSTPQRGGYQGYQSREILHVIKSFLESLRQKDYGKAFSEYVSEGFKRSFSIEKFTDFFKEHPEFGQSQSSQFDKLIFTNQLATFTGSLSLGNSKEIPVQFDLIPEEGKWKITHFYALPAANISEAKETLSAGLTPSGAMEFSKAIFGTRVDATGNILDPIDHFNPNSEDIYVQLFVKNGLKGDILTLMLRHLESDSHIPPLKAQLVENGDDILSFIFSPPPKGWPKGSYQLQVSSPETSNTFTFQVNE